MLDFSHITDLRASLPSNNVFNFFGSATVVHFSMLLYCIITGLRVLYGSTHTE